MTPSFITSPIGFSKRHIWQVLAEEQQQQVPPRLQLKQQLQYLCPGIAGWFGVTTAVAVPTVGTTIAAVAFPITALAAGGIATTYVVQNARWKKKTTFDDPRKYGSPINTEPLSRVEKGEFLTLVGGSIGDFSASSAPSAACLLGMYSGVHVGVISAACAPGSAAIAAPVSVAVVAGGISVGIKKAS